MVYVAANVARLSWSRRTSTVVVSCLPQQHFSNLTLMLSSRSSTFSQLVSATIVFRETFQESHNARTSFEEARFNLVGALHNIEAKKRFEFLEADTGVMDAHHRYFQQAYGIVIHGIFHMQFRTYADFKYSFSCKDISYYMSWNLSLSRLSLNGPYSSPSGEGVQMQPFSKISNSVVDAVTESAANGKVRIIRQGYLSKRSSNLRGDWKRRFFVLDSRGVLYYYHKPWNGSHVNVIYGDTDSIMVYSGLDDIAKANVMAAKVIQVITQLSECGTPKGW